MINITINIESICTGSHDSTQPVIDPIGKVMGFLDTLRNVVDTARGELERQKPESCDCLFHRTEGQEGGLKDCPKFKGSDGIDAEFIDPEVDGEPEKAVESKS